MTINAPDALDETALAANRERMIRDLRAKLDVLELRYEIRSSELRDALTRGEIRETAEVASWLIAWGTYCALLDERQARGE